MIWPSTRGDCLRAVGHFLDTVGATHVHLEEGDTRLLVRYTHNGDTSETQFTAEELQALVEAARTQRGKRANPASPGLEQRLRAIGQDMERKRARNIRIDESDRAFLIRYFLAGEGIVRSTYLFPTVTSLMGRGERQRREADAE